MKTMTLCTRTMILCAVLFLAGCATTRAVEVPVVVPCVRPQLPKKPHLAIYDLTPTSRPDDVIKAYVASVESLNFLIDTLYAEEGA